MDQKDETVSVPKVLCRFCHGSGETLSNDSTHLLDTPTTCQVCMGEGQHSIFVTVPECNQSNTEDL